MLQGGEALASQTLQVSLDACSLGQQQLLERQPQRTQKQQLRQEYTSQEIHSTRGKEDGLEDPSALHSTNCFSIPVRSTSGSNRNNDHSNRWRAAEGCQACADAQTGALSSDEFGEQHGKQQKEPVHSLKQQQQLHHTQQQTALVQQQEAFTAFVPWPGRADYYKGAKPLPSFGEATRATTATQSPCALRRELQLLQHGLVAAAATSSSSNRNGTRNESSVGRAVRRQASKLKRLTANLLSLSISSTGSTMAGSPPAAGASSRGSGPSVDSRILVGEDALMSDLPLEVDEGHRALQPFLSWGLEWSGRHRSLEAGILTLVNHSSPLKSVVPQNTESTEFDPLVGLSAKAAPADTTAAVAGGVGAGPCPYIFAFEDIVEQFAKVIPRYRCCWCCCCCCCSPSSLDAAKAKDDLPGVDSKTSPEKTAGYGPETADRGAYRSCAAAAADDNADAEGDLEDVSATAESRDNASTLGISGQEGAAAPADTAACASSHAYVECDNFSLARGKFAAGAGQPEAARETAPAEGTSVAETETEAAAGAEVADVATAEAVRDLTTDDAASGKPCAGERVGAAGEAELALDEAAEDAAAEVLEEVHVPWGTAGEVTRKAAADAAAEAGAALETTACDARSTAGEASAARGSRGRESEPIPAAKGSSVDDQYEGTPEQAAEGAEDTPKAEPVASPTSGGPPEKAVRAGSVEECLRTVGVDDMAAAPKKPQLDIFGAKAKAAATGEAVSSPLEELESDELHSEQRRLSSRQLTMRGREEDPEALEARQLRMGLSDFPEWLMQVDADADEQRPNPYKAVRLRKTGLLPAGEDGNRDEATARRIRARLDWMKSCAAKGKQQGRLPGAADRTATTPETISQCSSRSASKAPEDAWRHRQFHRQGKPTRGPPGDCQNHQGHITSDSYGPVGTDYMGKEQRSPEGEITSVAALRARFERSRADWFKGELHRFSRLNDPRETSDATQ